MPSLPLGILQGRAPRLLVLGAHSDDVEIGCGGTVRLLLERRPGAEVRWVVIGRDIPRGRAERAARGRISWRAPAPQR